MCRACFLLTSSGQIESFQKIFRDNFFGITVANSLNADEGWSLMFDRKSTRSGRSGVVLVVCRRLSRTGPQQPVAGCRRRTWQVPNRDAVCLAP
ncbi:hypothetical protein L5515_014025 [Caenorhabditis briggsae]|uniref:Uncharacterized protein n=1 Tax=Caenorhabditis briggsae TaxID=6238 RepID=A0AAE9J6B1_CAEBR|nr:hypothetical protein L5515_014025 [Caenorhabditis briggsae]